MRSHTTLFSGPLYFRRMLVWEDLWTSPACPGLFLEQYTAYSQLYLLLLLLLSLPTDATLLFLMNVNWK